MSTDTDHATVRVQVYLVDDFIAAPYSPAAPMRLAHEVTMTTLLDGRMAARATADVLFHAWNSPAEYLTGEMARIREAYRAAGNRSLSTGDVLVIDVDEDTYTLAVAPVGWQSVDLTPTQVAG